MAEKQKTENQITIQKIYLKDFSFESPNTPSVFTSGNGPQIQISTFEARTHRVVTTTLKSYCR